MDSVDNFRVAMRRAPGRILQPAALLAVAVLSCLAYLWMSSTQEGLGFPLDDAWIHQTYARNLVAEGEWAFVPGRPSAGSTAPLWTLLIAAGHALRIEPRLWTYALGAAVLLAVALVGTSWAAGQRGLAPGWRWLLAGLLLIEWHLVWAAVSGMETLALALSALLVHRQLERGPGKYAWAGAFIGLAVWIRPDALSLLLPAGWVAILDLRRHARTAVRAAALFSAGLVIPLLPYFLLHALLGQEWFPSTFYAKQAEYAILRTQPLVSRVLAQLTIPLVGIGVCLLPGLAADLRRIVASGSWRMLGAHAWIASYLLLYALRLPVTYQHGRYAIPVIPVLIALSVRGMSLAARPASPRPWERVLARVWIGVVVAVGLAFWVRGGRAYAEDVAIIETEMVATARWVEEHTEPGVRVAAHDIGALGYFAHRELIDLAGLVSPEVIPILRDEVALAEFLDEEGADYLVTFPGWYPRLVRGLEAVHRSGGPFSPRAGGENMIVYRWGPAH